MGTEGPYAAPSIAVARSVVFCKLLVYRKTHFFTFFLDNNNFLGQKMSKLYKNDFHVKIYLIWCLFYFEKIL